MASDLTKFWRRLQTGFEVAVASSSSARLLGVRDGFYRYFHEGLGSRVAIGVSSRALEESANGLPLSDRETIERAAAQARLLFLELGGKYEFCVSVLAGVEHIEAAGKYRSLLRSWCVVVSPLGEAWGSSGAIEIPSQSLESDPLAPEVQRVLGTRKQGGVTSALTGGLETRRSATALSIFHALSSLGYGILQSDAHSGGFGRRSV